MGDKADVEAQGATEGNAGSSRYWRLQTTEALPETSAKNEPKQGANGIQTNHPNRAPSDSILESKDRKASLE